MSLENLTITQLVSLFNVQASKPVKKFGSKKAALDALAKQEAEAADINEYQNRFDIAYAELLGSKVEEPAADEPAQEPANEPAADEPAADPAQEPAADEPAADKPAEEEPAASPAPAATGFQYKTRDELKALAAANPAARTAYRMERRKAARTARKAKKKAA